MLCCECVSGDPQKALPLATGIELIHNFTLVHDDIMDHSLLRRNLPAVHVKFGEPAAILAGDLLFAKSFEALLETSVEFTSFKQLQQDFINCIIAICEGQQLDMEYEVRQTVTEQQYLEMISKKTGALFELCAKGGGLVGGGTPKEIAALQTYGMSLGLAFQIWDDYLDVSSTKSTLGKDIGNDIRNGKKTLIAVHSLTHASGKAQKQLEDSFGNRQATEQEIAVVYDIFRDLGSVDYAQHRAVQFVNKAKEALTSLRSSDALELLNQLIEYTIQREK
jgi:geranylgeranyl diphosphate synthase type I